MAFRQHLIALMQNSNFSGEAFNEFQSALTHNLNMIRLANTDRDFDENDYEMLLSLDEVLTNQTDSQSTLRISQLPTFAFNEKAEKLESAEGETPGAPEEDLENFKKEQLKCSVCLEYYVEGE